MYRINRRGFELKQNILNLQLSKQNNEVLTWLTCYDYSFARVMNETELDMILVGDSGGMVLLGFQDTVPVTMEQMLIMCSAVRRGAPDKFIVGDMPKGSYEASNESAIMNAMRFVKECGADAVKLEGGKRMAERVKAIVDSGIPVIGHVGLTPQSSAAFGGYRVTGRTENEFDSLLEDCFSLQAAGASSILLEAMPAAPAGEIKKKLGIPILGIGAGVDVDGQLLILHDLLGMYPNFRPKFAKNYIPLALDTFSKQLSSEVDLVKYGKETRRDGIFELSRIAIDLFINDVKSKRFPNSEFTYSA
jgi:3-methyl-2-oxobutanoate hydroxymethyltransferase